MHAQERTLGTPEIEEIEDKFPTNRAYQSNKEQTEWYVTRQLKQMQVHERTISTPE